MKAMDTHIDFCERNCLSNKKEFESGMEAAGGK